MKTEYDSLLQQALQGDLQALEQVSRDPQAVEDLHFLRSLQPWNQQISQQAALLNRRRAPVRSWLHTWLRPAMLVPATALSAVLWLVTLSSPVQQRHTVQTTSPPQAQATRNRLQAEDRLFVGDFDDQPPPMRQRLAPQTQPARPEPLFNGDFERNG